MKYGLLMKMTYFNEDGGETTADILVKEYNKEKVNKKLEELAILLKAEGAEIVHDSE